MRTCGCGWVVPGVAAVRLAVLHLDRQDPRVPDPTVTDAPTRDAAQALLRRLAGDEAVLRDDQTRAIEALVD